jgi:hypothetical protein
MQPLAELKVKVVKLAVAALLLPLALLPRLHLLLLDLDDFPLNDFVQEQVLSTVLAELKALRVLYNGGVCLHVLLAFFQLAALATHVLLLFKGARLLLLLDALVLRLRAGKVVHGATGASAEQQRVAGDH